MRLVLLHGHDSSPDRLATLADGLRAAFPAAEVAVPAGTCPVGEETWAWWDDDGPLTSAAAALESLRDDVAIHGAVVIGFSQGGALALAAALTPGTGVAGAVCAGGFLPEGVEVAGVGPALLLLHGDDDEVVDVFYAETLERTARRAGLDVELQTYPGGHDWSADAVDRIAGWLRDR